jgi:DNA repair protein RecN (Recombination protein N)
VLCVTHLPQLACFGDQHVIVEKKIAHDRTETVVRSLTTEERPRELARMLGGPTRSTTALDHANELLEAAGRLKRRMRGSTD